MRDMAEAEILRTIEKIGSFLIRNKNTVLVQTKRDKGRAKVIRNELQLILEFLAAKKSEDVEGSSRLKYWISDVVEMAHDAHYMIHDEHNFCDEIYHIYSGLRETRKRILQLGVEGADKSPIITSPSPLDEYVVGLERDMESVLRKSVLYEARGLCAMCIEGMVGTGKTTLAREVYDNPTTIDRFELRVWVTISGEPSNKEVLMKLIREVTNGEDRSHVLLEEMESESLQRMLHQHLQGKQFLVVLDNMGKIPYFSSIFKALPNEEDKRSRLLLTSRFRSIKDRVQDYAPLSTHLMKTLDEDRSWELFLKLLFFADQQFPKRLEKEGREMLRSCEGLPLSIKEVAAQFVIKRQGGSEWEELLGPTDLSVTFSVLESIYDRWPPQLKLCFLCLSFFKKGIPIRREKLVQVWTAGQVIPQEKEEEDSEFQTVEFKLDFLEGYKTTLMRLVDESIIEVDMSKNQCIKCICVNASFHTLSMAKAEKAMVLETLKKCESDPPSSKESRHRAIYCSRDEFNHFTDHDEYLLSLFYRGGGCFDASEPYWKCFEQLRTLDFEGFGLKMLPETIGSLTELRYLGLRDNYIKELPQSLCRLKNLEVLDIALNFTMEVPDILWEIISLRHLYMSDIICLKPLKIDTLKNLETLTYISVDNWTSEVSSLKMMTGLHKLGIESVDENSDLSEIFASLEDLNLHCLILRGFRSRSLPLLHGLERLFWLREIRLDGLITKLPSAGIFPGMITHVSLINSRLDEDPMPKLGNLYYLWYLKLKNAYTGQEMVIPSEMFYNLQVLCVEELWHLRNIKVEARLGMLTKLEIKSCPYLENIPEIIYNGPMKEMKMLTTRRLAAKVREADFISKIEHVDIQP